MGQLQERYKNYREPQKFMEADVYPYFRAIEGKQGTEVEMGGHKVLMFGSNAYTGLTGDQRIIDAAKAALDKVTVDIAGVHDGTDVIISLTDPGWCRTDLGGPNAPNAPESAIPGVVVGAFVDDGKSGRILGAGLFYDMTLEEAVEKAHSIESPY